MTLNWTRSLVQAVKALIALFALSVIAVGFALRTEATPAIEPACGRQLRDLWWRMQRYSEDSLNLPPAHTTDLQGNRLHSWRTLLLAYIYQAEVYCQVKLKEPWNSPHNDFLARVEAKHYRSPYAVGGSSCTTSYVAVCGKGTAWGVGKDTLQVGSRDKEAETIVVVEMKNSDIHWAEPRDLDLDNLPPGVTKENLPERLANHESGFYALFADGHYEFIRKDIPWDTFMAMLTIDGGETIKRTW